MIEELLKYQEEDAKLKAIENVFAENEDRKKASSAKKFLETAPDTVNKLDERAQSLQAEYEKIKGELDKLNEQAQEFESALNAVKETGEITFLLKKADELSSKIKQNSDRLNQIAEEMQKAVKEFATVKGKINVAQEQFKESRAKYAEFKKTKEDEFNTVKSNLEKLKNSVDPDLMNRYLAKRDNKMYPVAYEVKDKICGCCNVELSLDKLSRRKNGEVIDCEFCGRMLYMGKK